MVDVGRVPSVEVRSFWMSAARDFAAQRGFDETFEDWAERLWSDYKEAFSDFLSDHGDTDTEYRDMFEVYNTEFWDALDLEEKRRLKALSPAARKQLYEAWAKTYRAARMRKGIWSMESQKASMPDLRGTRRRPIQAYRRRR